jgi:hypothetical protein
MSILSKIKSKDKKALTIAFIVVAVTITSFSMGAYCISSALLSKGSISGRLANNQRTSQVHIEKSTQANTSVDTSVNVMLAKESAVISKNNTYTVHLAEGLIKEKLNLKWSSDNTKVATVSKNGVVTAVGQGNAEVYCIADSGVESSCEIIVLALNATEITVEQYDSYILDVFGATENITWYTGNIRVATVTKDGKITGRSVGSTIITAKVNGKILRCKVNVVKISK